jgi:type II secretory ATPase GspE/PulE/Tfp pilus assembly ATPase PilB-like protein/ActR/RegA family two-component response regulator
MGDKKTVDFRTTPAGGQRDAGFRAFLAGTVDDQDHDLELVAQHAQRHDTTFVEAIVALGFLNEMKAYAAYAEWMGRPFVDLRVTPPSATAARLLPEKVARAHQILPIAHDNRTFTYASSVMFNADVDRDVAFASGRRPQMVLVAPGQLTSAMSQAYRLGQTIDKLIDRIKVEDMSKPIDVPSMLEPSDSPIINLCNQIVATALAAGASDIHIEPGVTGAAVRHRIGGILEPLLTLPESAVRGVTNRFKLMANADISVKLKPQDGSFRVSVVDQSVDVRLSALPTIHGEKLVMRVIQGGASMMTIDTLGYNAKAEQALIAALSKPDGLVLVTGPTGSGKTTVLYAALQFLATGRVNIVTVEDPVERQLAGTTQIAVNVKTGNTFVNVLRSVMRQDPNIIMVGEVRDNEVADIVGQAAYTGHLVLSSLHTTDAASAITRLLNLGLAPFKVAESLNAVVAQRLVRKLCTHCCERHDDATAEGLGKEHGLTRVAASVGRGCDQCKQTGYAGRIAVPEVMVPDEALRTAIRNGAGVGEIRTAMRAAGSASMRETALELVVDGVTSIDEVNRVLTNHDEAKEVEPTSKAAGQLAAAAAPPVAAAPPKAVAPIKAAPAPAQVLPTVGNIRLVPPRPVETRRVLIADDDRMIRLIVRMLLEKDGYKVLEAENGAVAMETARREHPDLMLVDLQMPDMDGFQVVEMMRSDPRLTAIPVIVLTSETSSEVETRVLEMGADDYVMKPFEPEVLLSRVRAAFRRMARAA